MSQDRVELCLRSRRWRTKCMDVWYRTWDTCVSFVIILVEYTPGEFEASFHYKHEGEECRTKAPLPFLSGFKSLSWYRTNEDIVKRT